MREEIRFEERTITDEIVTYIADDGKEFDNKKDCKDYERNCKLKDLEAKFDAMIIEEYSDIAPITLVDDFYDKGYSWVNLKSDEDYNLIMDYYSVLYPRLNFDYMCEPETYPALVCIVETDDYIETFYFDDIMASTRAYFKQFNIDVEFNKKN